MIFRLSSAPSFCVGLICTLASLWSFPASGQAPEAAPARVGQFVTIDKPISDEVVLGVRRALNDLKMQATQGKKAYLVLEIHKGSSPFHHVYALADLLSSDASIGVTTVAWIPEPLVGVHAFPALACQEVVMAPEATIGDLGNGQPLSPDEQLIVRSIADRRRNRKLSPEIVTALLDPQQAIVRLTRETKPGETETVVTTKTEAERLRAAGAVIKSSETLREAGETKVFSGAEARALDIIAVQTAADRPSVAKLYNLPLEALREKPLEQKEVQAAIIEVRDPLDAVNTAFIKRQIERAESGKVQTIVFVLDGPGGYNYECLDLAQTLASLQAHNVRTVAFVPKRAVSGEAVIALGCDEIYIAPTATFGDIGAAIDKMNDGERDNARRILEQGLESLAEVKNRPPALLRAMLDKDLEVFQATNQQTGEVTYKSEAELARAGDEWKKGALVPETKRGSLMTVDGIRATELQIARRPVGSLDELRTDLGIASDAVLRPMKKTWVDNVVFFLNRRDVTVLVFFAMFMCWYFEAVTGTGLFAIASLLCMALFFWSRVLGGTADRLELMLFIIGTGLLLLEIFVIPGFGVFGICGILLVLLSIVMASQTFVGAIDPSRDIIAASKTLTSLGGAVAAVIVTGLILSRFLPNVPLLRDMVLVPPSADPVSSEPRLRPEQLDDLSSLTGKTGKAITMLRPAGKVEIDGRLVEVVSEGGFIPEGTAVEVIHASKQRIIVRTSTV
jgi:membrane-bound serine protease (ClpP class)